MFVHKVLFEFLEFKHPRLLLVSPSDTSTGGGLLGVKFLASENWCGRVHFGGHSPEWRVLAKFSVQHWKWHYFACTGLTTGSPKNNFPQNHTINPLLAKLVGSRRLDIGVALFVWVYGPLLHPGPKTCRQRTWSIYNSWTGLLITRSFEKRAPGTL